jgi:hypothetical protein
LKCLREVPQGPLETRKPRLAPEVQLRRARATASQNAAVHSVGLFFLLRQTSLSPEPPSFLFPTLSFSFEGREAAADEKEGVQRVYYNDRSLQFVWVFLKVSGYPLGLHLSSGFCVNIDTLAPDSSPESPRPWPPSKVHPSKSTVMS